MKEKLGEKVDTSSQFGFKNTSAVIAASSKTRSKINSMYWFPRLRSIKGEKISINHKGIISSPKI